jgi:hypothetical protein
VAKRDGISHSEEERQGGKRYSNEGAEQNVSRVVIAEIEKGEANHRKNVA